ncbi:DUF5054 domain-containing protein [Agromyces cerinus]|uniref:Glycosyl hydrolases family 38 N-terminal domain-containing protein n=1 Tax=Agromyces cerinus subsp. cerinus TaxID=232089 RepID=A0A1N6F7C9_9MICO|nr:DUF5054 domain-containing protein [Agromyces cerinus]SIN91116.1 protein of unknown function [Agromyces cerinus subsp. cerinus]
MITTLHVVFKTHLDLGFTDTAANVTDRYVHEYLPRAIALAEELERRGGPARFIWTTGSWLIHEALRLGDADERAALEAAIRAGHVTWHGLPLTTHTESMDAGLVEHGIAIGRKLDARFGHRTLAAKMTDVPGHTIGLVPFLARGGLDFLHLGVNGASAVPDVPEFFVWRAPDGSEVVVNYAQSYGATELGVAVVPGGTSALHLAHTGDNFGPPPVEEVEALFAELQAAYPGAEVIASTLDAFSREAVASRASLPVLEQEIGDSWIHGIASDPVQTARFRALLRLRTAWIAAGALVPGTEECDAFSDGLLLVPEHTWGEDLKTYLPDYVNYEKADFQRAREADVVDPAANPAEFDEYAWAYTEHPSPQGLAYSAFERSWAEQRAHLDRALAALSPERRAEAEAAIAGTVPHDVDPSATASAEPIGLDAELSVGRFRVRFGDDGSLVSLIDGDGTEWAGPEHPLAAYRYETFDERDEARWMREYCRDMKANGMWAVPDQSKPGLAIAETLPATTFAPRVTSAERFDDGTDTVVVLRLALPDAACEAWGGPRDIRLAYRFPAEPGPIEVTLDLRDKDASRLPEASWLGFRPLTEPGAWRLTKLETPVDPQSVVRNGNRSLHAVAEVAHTAAKTFSLRPVDAALVAVGRPALYRFDNTVPDPNDGMHVNLHNNMWGTNFTMWFDDDLRFRFVLDLGTGAGVAR